MVCTGKGNIVCDESSSDSNPSMRNLECSNDLNMLYLLASVAEEVSFDRLHALANAAMLSASTSSTCETHTTKIPAAPEKSATEAPSVYDERGIFRIKCPFCSRCFSRKENLRWHMKKHNQENIPAEDSTIPTSVPSLLPADQFAAERRESRLVSVVPDSSGFWCPKCEKNFQREATFRVHMRFHTRKRPAFSLPLHCKKCAELCTTKTQYLIHKKMHRMEKVFKRRGLLSEPAEKL